MRSRSTGEQAARKKDLDNTQKQWLKHDSTVVDAYTPIRLDGDGFLDWNSNGGHAEARETELSLHWQSLCGKGNHMCDVTGINMTDKKQKTKNFHLTSVCKNLDSTKHASAPRHFSAHMPGVQNQKITLARATQWGKYTSSGRNSGKTKSRKRRGDSKKWHEIKNFGAVTRRERKEGKGLERNPASEATS